MNKKFNSQKAVVNRQHINRFDILSILGIQIASSMYLPGHRASMISESLRSGGQRSIAEPMNLSMTARATRTSSRPRSRSWQPQYGHPKFSPLLPIVYRAAIRALYSLLCMETTTQYSRRKGSDISSSEIDTDRESFLPSSES